jgi:hypothetical protein
MEQLGIARPEEVISDKHLAQYAEFFDGPLESWAITTPERDAFWVLV